MSFFDHIFISCSGVLAVINGILHRKGKDKLQKHFDPKTLPIKKWKAEQAELLKQKAVLNGKYDTLKKETREVEEVRREVDRIIRSERPKQRARTQGMEL